MEAELARGLASAIARRRDAGWAAVRSLAEGDLVAHDTIVSSTADEFADCCKDLAEACGLGDFWSPDPFEARRDFAGVADTFLVSALEEFDSGAEGAIGAASEVFTLECVLRQLDADMKAAWSTRQREVDVVELDRQQAIVTNEYWECFELAIFRLCGAWDRAAQLISFVFFNVREFDRDTFTVVIERMKLNFVRLEPLFAEHAAWVALKRYADDESEAGLRSLVRRRNALVHSIGLDYSRSGGAQHADERPRNALDVKRAEKLRQLSPGDEAVQVRAQVETLARLRVEVVKLCLFGIRTYRLRPLRFGRSSD